MPESPPLKKMIQTHDDESFRELVRKYHPMVAGICARRLRDPADREDAVQETFIKLARGAGQIREALGPWLYRTANHTAIDLIRRKAARDRHERIGGELMHTRHEHAQQAGPPLHEQALLDDAIAELSGDDQQLIVSYYFETLTQRDIAEQLGINQSTVKRRIDTALQSLRDRLSRRGVALTAAALGSTLSAAQASAQTTDAAINFIVQQAFASGVSAPTTLSGTVKMWVASHKIASGLILTTCVAAPPALIYATKAQAPQPYTTPVTQIDGPEPDNPVDVQADTQPQITGIWIGTRRGYPDDQVTVNWTHNGVTFEGTSPERRHVAVFDEMNNGESFSFAGRINESTIPLYIGQQTAGRALVVAPGEATLALAAPGQTDIPADLTGDDGSRVYNLTRHPINDLQGNWDGTEQGRPNSEIRMTITGTTLVYSANDGTRYEARVTAMSDTDEPATMDLTIVDSNIDELVGLSAVAIYQRNENTLTIAGQQPGRTDRPTGFIARGSVRVMEFVWSVDQGAPPQDQEHGDN